MTKTYEKLNVNLVHVLKKKVEDMKYTNLLLNQERSMFVAGPVVVFKWQNKEGWPVEYVSSNVKDVFGYSAEEFISGKVSYEKIILKEDLARVGEEVENYSKSGVVRFENIPYRIIRKDKKIMTISDFTTIIRDKDGDITHYLGYVTDVTEKELAEEKLRQSEEKNHIFIDNFVGMAYQIDFNNPKKGINLLGGKIKEITGYSKKDFFDKIISWLDIIHPDDLSLIRGERKNMISKRDYTATLEYRIIHKDGSVRWVKDIAKLIGLKDKALIQGSVYDITTSKEISEKLKESEDRFKILFEFAPDAYFLNDLDGNIIDCNKLAYESLGYTKDEMVGNNFLKLNIIPKEDLHIIIRINEKTKQGLPSGPTEIRIITKQGETKIMEISTYPVGIKGQKFVLGVTHDITDRKNSEDNLKNQKVFMESVVENIPNMIFVKDAKQFKFEEMNKAGELLLGLKRKDILGKNLLEKFSKSQADFFLSKDREVIKSGKLLDIPEEFIDTPKGTRILHTKKIPIFDEKSKPLYLLGISEDITEKKKAEEKLKQSEEKYKQLTQTIAKPMFTINKKGIFLFINKEAAMQLRSTPEKMIGKTMWQFFPKKIAYRQMILICKVISSGKSIKLEERLLISGKLRWYETTMWPVKDNQGKIIAAQAIAIDITKFKKENEDLKRRLKKKCS